MSPIYTVYRAGESRLRVTRAELLENGTHLLKHNGVLLPITIEGQNLTVHASQAEGTNLDLGFVFPTQESGETLSGGIRLDDSRMIALLPDIQVTLHPVEKGSPRSKYKAGLVIYGDYNSYEPSLYVELHERSSKNFPHSSGKERK